jgi:hypothetical protein
MRATTVAHQVKFENAFSEEWTEAEPESQACTVLIDHIIQLYDFPSGSVMVRYIDQKQWKTLSQVVSVGLDEVKEFSTMKSDGVTFEATPMLVHIRSFKAILLCYCCMMCWREGPSDDDVVYRTPKDLPEYFSSKA